MNEEWLLWFGYYLKWGNGCSMVSKNEPYCLGDWEIWVFVAVGESLKPFWETLGCCWWFGNGVGEPVMVEFGCHDIMVHDPDFSWGLWVVVWC